MKPHPKIRKTVKWGGAVVSVVLLLLWAASARWRLSADSALLGHADLGSGVYGWNNGAGAAGPRMSFSVTRADEDSIWDWWFGWQDDYTDRLRLVLGWNVAPGAVYIWVLAWLPLLLTVPPTTAAWWLDARARRRAMTHLCRKCRYDRTGLAADAKCPECGAAGKSATDQHR